MGTDYGAHLGVGFLVTVKDFDRLMGAKYKPNTDPPEDTDAMCYIYENTIYDQYGTPIDDYGGDQYGKLWELLGDKLDCHVQVINEPFSEQYDFTMVAFSVREVEQDDPIEICGRFMIDGPMYYKSLTSKKVQAELQAIRKRLVNFGLDPGGPVVYINGWAG